jgi:hypothetical protein
MIYEYEESWQNDNDRRKLKNSVKNMSQYHFVHQKFHMELALVVTGW